MLRSALQRAAEEPRQSPSICMWGKRYTDCASFKARAISFNCSLFIIAVFPGANSQLLNHLGDVPAVFQGGIEFKHQIRHVPQLDLPADFPAYESLCAMKGLQYLVLSGLIRLFPKVIPQDGDIDG